ncbi:NUDIX domain-containing protein [Paenibacillus humicola]|uniref:NUDIX domain-containing protein n=1 Tax=Paenibacillus humicola TaxID=3110540 RepID=UPI00237AD4CA|nr:NUDIX domain-containing protein [Paenibacillus humicola]
MHLKLVKYVKRGKDLLKIVRKEKNADGIPLPNETYLVISDLLPIEENITCSFVLAFRDHELLLTNLTDRGWDIPGGHIEPGETPFEAMKRELFEETGARIESAELIGHELIRLNGEKPPHWKYPYPESYMVFYTAKIIGLDNFESNDETKGRGFSIRVRH